MRWLPVTSLALVGATAALAACADDVGCPGADSFALTAPDGFAELVPGASVTIRWRADDDPGALVQLRAIASDGVADVALAPAALADGAVTWDGRADGARVPAANYRLGGEVARVGGCGATPIAADDLHLIVVQGVRLPTAALAFTGSQATRPVAVTTVTRSMVPLELALDPDPGVDGDELVFAAALIPGEFTPTARSYPFTGLTTTGAAIPAGSYDLTARFGTGGARTVGPRVRWDPAL